jgi:hypothetical protein
VLAPDSTFILEHANKHNLKAILRYALKRQMWNPDDLTPVEFVELNFDFHPDYIVHELEAAHFSVEKRIPVSFFRLGILKNNLPTALLVGMDSLMQRSGLLYAPSVFAQCKASREGDNNLDTTLLFVCPETGAELEREGDTFVSSGNGSRWAIRDGIYDFKAPLD